MAETLSPITDVESEPLSQRWGIAGGGGLSVPIRTSFTEGGIGADLKLKLDIAESMNEYYSLMANYLFAITGENYTPSSGYDPGNDLPEVPGYEVKHQSLVFGLGRFTRTPLAYAEDTRVSLSSLRGYTPVVGAGWRSQSQDDQTVDETNVGFSDDDITTFEMAAISTLFGLEMRPSGRDWTFTLSSAIKLGCEYDEPGSKFNRLSLVFMPLQFTMGYGDASTARSADNDTRVGPLAYLFAGYSLLHGWGMRLLMNDTLQDQQKAWSDYWEGTSMAGGGGDRGSTADVPLFSGASAFMAGSDPTMTIALRSGEVGFWSFAAAKTLGDALFLASGSEAGKISGAAAPLSGLRYIGMGIAGIHTPESRRAFSTGQSVRDREMIVNASSFALGTLALLAGAAAESPVMTKAGTTANVFEPDPVGYDLDRRTDTRYAVSIVNADKDRLRGGFLIHHSWRGAPLFSSVSLMSPMMLPGNAASYAPSTAGAETQDEPYTNANQSTDVDAAMGVEWLTPYTRLMLGLDTKAIFGSESAHAGIGATAGFDVIIPFGEGENSGISLGLRATATKNFPEGGQFELIPGFGASIYHDLL